MSDSEDDVPLAKRVQVAVPVAAATAAAAASRPVARPAPKPVLKRKSESSGAPAAKKAKPAEKGKARAEESSSDDEEDEEGGRTTEKRREKERKQLERLTAPKKGVRSEGRRMRIVCQSAERPCPTAGQEGVDDPGAPGRRLPAPLRAPRPQAALRRQPRGLDASGGGGARLAHAATCPPAGADSRASIHP